LLKRPQKNLSRTDLALMIIESEKEKEQLEIQIKEDAPKVAFAKDVSESGGITVQSFAAILGIDKMGRNNLFKWFKDQGYLTKSKMPYRQYLEARYFDVIERTYFDKEKRKTQTYRQVLITGKGQVFFHKKINQI